MLFSPAPTPPVLFPMRFLEIETFVALARNRHFGKTAEQLNITQPAISHRLATLETQFGRRLINRADRAFELTVDGDRVLRTFETILAEMDELRTALSIPGSSEFKPLRIGAIDSISSTWMPWLINDLHQAFPSQYIDLTVDSTKHLSDGMRLGDLDLIFCLDTVVGDGFATAHACTLEMVWAGAPSLIDPERIYRVSELAALPIISFPRNSPPFRMIAPYFHDEQALASKLTSCNSLYAIINLLIDGFGVGAIPTVAIARELESGLLATVRTIKPFPPMPIVATYRTTIQPNFIRGVISQTNETVRRYCREESAGKMWVD